MTQPSEVFTVSDLRSILQALLIATEMQERVNQSPAAFRAGFVTAVEAVAIAVHAGPIGDYGAMDVGFRY